MIPSLITANVRWKNKKFGLDVWSTAIRWHFKLGRTYVEISAVILVEKDSSSFSLYKIQEFHVQIISRIFKGLSKARF